MRKIKPSEVPKATKHVRSRITKKALCLDYTETETLTDRKEFTYSLESQVTRYAAIILMRIANTKKTDFHF